MRRAFSFVPTPTSARLVPNSPWALSSRLYSDPKPSSAEACLPLFSAKVARVSDSPNGARSLTPSVFAAIVR